MKLIWSSGVVLSSLNNGNYFTTKQTSKKPRIILDENDKSDKSEKNNKQNKNLLMMYDPDARTPFIHWITTLDGQDILPYYPPSPPEKTGLHRYMFCLISSPPSTNNRMLDKMPNCKPMFYFLSKYFVNGGTLKKYMKKMKSLKSLKKMKNMKNIKKMKSLNSLKNMK